MLMHSRTWPGSELFALWLVVLAAWCAEPVIGVTVAVSRQSDQPVILQEMLNATVSALDFAIPSFILVPDAWKYITSDTPLVLTRNFTIASSAHPPTVIDYEFLAHRVVLSENVTFTFKNVVLSSIRNSSDQGVEWFKQSKGAHVRLENVTIVDLICQQTPAAAAEQARAAATPAGYPANNVSPVTTQLCIPNLPGTTGTQQQGTCFGGGVHYSNFATVTTYRDANRGHSQQGYILQLRNTTAVCRSYLDAQCLQQHGPDYCWAQQAQQLLGTGEQAGKQALPPAAAAGIAISVSVVAIAAVVAGGYCLWKRRKQQAGKQSLPVLQKGSPGLEFAASFNSDLNSRRSTSVAGSAADQSVAKMQSGRLSIGQHIQLGVCLGAGSFGRVYKGRWHGSSVAVKVMNCTQEELPKVLKEAEIMMKLEHDNIVRALYCTVVKKDMSKQESAHSKEATIKDGERSAGAGQQQQLSSHHSSRNSSTHAAGSSHGSGIAAAAAGSACATAAATSSDLSMAVSPRNSLTQQQQQQQEQRFVVVKGSNANSSSSSSAAGRLMQHQVHSGSIDDSGRAGRSGSSSKGVGGVGSSQPSSLRQRQQQQHHSNDDLLDSDDHDDAVEQDIVEVWLVMELCTGGQLKDACSRPKDTMELARLLSRLLEVSQGMEYLHSKGVLHGDLKAANVLLKPSIHGSYGQTAKLSDFGLASTLLEGATHRSTQTMGTITHTAPEVLASGRLSKAADVYAFGIMMWELFTGSSAWSSLHHYGAVVQRVLAGQRPPVPGDAPEEYQLLMRLCWAARPAERPSFEQITTCLGLVLDGLTSCSVDGPMLTPNSELAAAGQQQERVGTSHSENSSLTAAVASGGSGGGGATSPGAASATATATATAGTTATAVASVGPSSSSGSGTLSAHGSSSRQEQLQPGPRVVVVQSTKFSSAGSGGLPASRHIQDL